MIKRRNFLRDTNVREYDRGRFRNPIAHLPSANRKVRFFLITLGLLIFVGLGSYGFWFVGFGPNFAFNRVEVLGTVTISNTEIENKFWNATREKRYLLWHQDRRWLFNDQQLQDDLIKTFALKSAAVTVNDRAVTINIEEKITTLLWVSGDGVYVVDTDGRAIRRLDDVTAGYVIARMADPNAVRPENATLLIPTTPIIFDASKSLLNENALVWGGVVASVLDFDRLAREQAIIPRYYEIESLDSEWLKTFTTQDFYLLIDSMHSGEEQAKALHLVLGEHKDEDIKYIDLRFGNNVFLK